MNTMPVSSVGHGMGEPGPPSMESRSGGTPVTKSKSTACSARNTTSNDIPKNPIPLNVSATATARSPPVMV